MATVTTAQTPDLRTRAETTNYEETSTYADVERIMAGLAATSPLVYRESFGKTEQGRDMPLMIISDPKVATPDAARRLGRPLVFVQANILVGDVTKVSNPKSGREMNAMTDMAVAVPMKEFGTFMATRSLPMPKGWVIPANPRLAAALDRLRWHGVQLREIADAAQVPVERFSIADYTRSERAFQGHRERRARSSCPPTSRLRGSRSTCSSPRATTGW